MPNFFLSQSNNEDNNLITTNNEHSESDVTEITIPTENKLFL